MNKLSRALFVLSSGLGMLAIPVPAAETDPGVTVVTNAESRIELSVRPDDHTQPGNYKVEVFLPSNYAGETNSYPVLYVFDGSSLRREHDALLKEGLIRPAILVAIHNRAGESRFYDLTPSRDGSTPATSGGLPAFAELIVGRIKPYVDSHFRALRDAAHTGIAGNSLGGLAACWMGCQQPEVFGYAACFEPSLWWNEKELLKRLQNDTAPRNGTRFWIMAADQGDPGMWRNAKHAAFALLRRGWREGEDVAFYQVHNAPHGWEAVETQIRDALHFFLRKTAPELIAAELTICHGPQHAPIRLRESGEFSNAYLDLYFAGGFRATAIAPDLRAADPNVARIGDTVLGQIWPTGAGWTTVSAGYGGFQSSLAVQGFRLDGYPKTQLPVATTPITVDGNLRDWSDLPFGKTNGSSAGFRFGVSYDPDFVYVGVSVKDDQWVALPRLDDPPNQDAIEISLDARPDPLRSLGKGVERFFDFICMQMAPGERADAMKLRRRKGGFPAIPAGLRTICLRSADGYTAEVAIPVAALDRAQEKPWQEFRMNVAQYDMDETNGKVNVIWWHPDWRSDSNIVASGTFSRSGEPDRDE